MAKGRKRKTGPREKNGRPSRAGIPRFDKGTERVQAMRERYGEHYTSALGRAFALDLLGDGIEATVRLDVGKRFAAIHGKLIARPYRCPLNDAPRGMADDHDSHDRIEHDRAEQEWFFAMADKLDRAGLRPWLDQLISPVYTDHGPAWLDRLLDGGKDPVDLTLLQTAIKALDLIAPKVRSLGIRVAA